MRVASIQSKTSSFTYNPKYNISEKPDELEFVGLTETRICEGNAVPKKSIRERFHIEYHKNFGNLYSFEMEHIVQELIVENVVTADGANRNRVYILKSNAQS
jgi:hypothetical protein